MSLATISLYADDEAGFSRTLRLAAQVGRRHRAHLLGIGVLARALVLPAGAPGTPDAVTVEMRRQASRTASQAMERALREAAAADGLTCDWQLVDGEHGDAASQVAALARATDLVVTSPPTTHWGELGPLDMADRLVTGTGRPVLLAPRRVESHTVGRRVVVAWNGSREAARATFDAVPLLRQADAVTLLTVSEDDGRSLRSREHLRPIRQSLARHGIRTHVEELQLTRPQVGAGLLSAAKACNADLLVMGCYGHSRLSEFVLGGATRHVFHHATLAVMMSQ